MVVPSGHGDIEAFEDGGDVARVPAVTEDERNCNRLRILRHTQHSWRPKQLLKMVLYVEFLQERIDQAT
jgi:hypothetical protein